ncbi:hypothetical protein [Pseudotenacibaculum haliotis]|uniref:Uncharacterized protein n=1 Tax=Pseudotenacibaculum haliotis TaxID=1862138 RepID=A0ABW5LPN7_9FLAO
MNFSVTLLTKPASISTIRAMAYINSNSNFHIPLRIPPRAFANVLPLLLITKAL